MSMETSQDDEIDSFVPGAALEASHTDVEISSSVDTRRIARRNVSVSDPLLFPSHKAKTEGSKPAPARSPLWYPNAEGRTVVVDMEIPPWLPEFKEISEDTKFAIRHMVDGCDPAEFCSYLATTIEDAHNSFRTMLRQGQEICSFLVEECMLMMENIKSVSKSKQLLELRSLPDLALSVNLLKYSSTFNRLVRELANSLTGLKTSKTVIDGWIIKGKDYTERLIATLRETLKGFDDLGAKGRELIRYGEATPWIAQSDWASIQEGLHNMKLIFDQTVLQIREEVSNLIDEVHAAFLEGLKQFHREASEELVKIHQLLSKPAKDPGDVQSQIGKLDFSYIIAIYSEQMVVRCNILQRRLEEYGSKGLSKFKQLSNDSASVVIRLLALPDMPTGMHFDTTTGAISGVPNKSMRDCRLHVKATTAGQHCHSCSILITIIDSLTLPKLASTEQIFPHPQAPHSTLNDEFSKALSAYLVGTPTNVRDEAPLTAQGRAIRTWKPGATGTGPLQPWKPKSDNNSTSTSKSADDGKGIGRLLTPNRTTDTILISAKPSTGRSINDGPGTLLTSQDQPPKIADATSKPLSLPRSFPAIAQQLDRSGSPPSINQANEDAETTARRDQPGDGEGKRQTPENSGTPTAPPPSGAGFSPQVKQGTENAGEEKLSVSVTDGEDGEASPIPAPEEVKDSLEVHSNSNSAKLPVMTNVPEGTSFLRATSTDYHLPSNPAKPAKKATLERSSSLTNCSSMWPQRRKSSESVVQPHPGANPSVDSKRRKTPELVMQQHPGANAPLDHIELSSTQAQERPAQRPLTRSSALHDEEAKKGEI